MTPDVPPVRRSRLRRIALDLTPLRVSRDFRLLWGGGFISELGSQFARIAVYVQVTELTGSAAAVGVVGLTGLLGIFLGTLVGGSFIDAHDRRRTLILAQVAHTARPALTPGRAIPRSPRAPPMAPAGRPPAGGRCCGRRSRTPPARRSSWAAPSTGILPCG